MILDILMKEAIGLNWIKMRWLCKILISVEDGIMIWQRKLMR